MGKLVNLKDETLKCIVDIGYSLDDVLGLHIEAYRDGESEKFVIDDVSDFDKLDFYYDCSYGFQLVDGWIVFKDKSWLERDEYDGSEWWEYRKCPM